MRKNRVEEWAAGLGMGAIVAFVVVLLSAIPAWITHVVVTISAIVGTGGVGLGYGALLIIGVFVPPVGVIHGWGVWFGWW